MDFIRLDKSDKNKPFVDQVTDWYYHWWGIRDGCEFAQVQEIVSHSLNAGNRLPQIFGAVENGKLVGTLCVSMSDDLRTRVDIYPWLANVYVEEKRRHQGIGRFMLSKVSGIMQEVGLDQLFLYTNHIGLYEKFGWEFVENVNTYKQDSPVERLYVLNLR